MTSKVNRRLLAHDLAIERHAGQLYGNQPYVVHLEAVFRAAMVFLNDEDTEVAAFLHDTLEDTETSRDELASRFGPVVADMVWAVTGVGKNRRERWASKVPKILGTPKALGLFLCDRYANAAHSRRWDAGLFEMYAREWPKVRDAFYGSTADHERYEPLWDALFTLFEPGAGPRHDGTSRGWLAQWDKARAR